MMPEPLTGETRHLVKRTQLFEEIRVDALYEPICCGDEAYAEQTDIEARYPVCWSIISSSAVSKSISSVASLTSFSTRTT
jgi:hypothetical protein